MYCVIYRSSIHDQTYLYVEKQNDFSRVPDDLLRRFGSPRFTMMLSLSSLKKLANADIEKVKISLQKQGFYLQLPPPPVNLSKTSWWNE